MFDGVRKFVLEKPSYIFLYDLDEEGFHTRHALSFCVFIYGFIHRLVDVTHRFPGIFNREKVILEIERGGVKNI
jgi:hypothetical protein